MWSTVFHLMAIASVSVGKWQFPTKKFLPAGSIHFRFVCYLLVIEMVFGPVDCGQLDDAPVDVAPVAASLAVALVPASLPRSNIGMRCFDE